MPGSMLTERRPDGTFSVRCALDSSPEDVRATLESIGDALRRLGRHVPEEAPWELVMAEVLNNVVEHAYQDKPGGDIQVQLEFTKDRLRAVVVDYGLAMPSGMVPAARQADLDVAVDDLPEGGFGWYLIHSLTEALVYQRSDDANHLMLELPYHS
jgi:serine/threonine-protein kinase RsbW